MNGLSHFLSAACNGEGKVTELITPSRWCAHFASGEKVPQPHGRGTVNREVRRHPQAESYTLDDSNECLRCKNARAYTQFIFQEAA